MKWLKGLRCTVSVCAIIRFRLISSPTERFCTWQRRSSTSRNCLIWRPVNRLWKPCWTADLPFTSSITEIPAGKRQIWGLDFYGKTVPDHFLSIIKDRHPESDIYMMAYCMGGTLMVPYLARRAQELMAAGKPMDVKKIALMASPVKFDDDKSGHGAIRSLIRRDYDPYLMEQLFGAVNVPSQVIEAGMNEIQPGVQHTVVLGFYGRAVMKESISESAPFLYWLTHGTKFPVTAHLQWIQNIFLGNQIYEGTYCLPSTNPAFDGKPVDMSALKEAGVRIFDYHGSRDPIAPAGSCVAGETWGMIDDGNIKFTSEHLNRTIEKNIGHIFVVSHKLLVEYLELVEEFFL